MEDGEVDMTTMKDKVDIIENEKTPVIVHYVVVVMKLFTPSHKLKNILMDIIFTIGLVVWKLNDRGEQCESFAVAFN